MTFHSDDWAWSAPRICTDVCGGCSAGWPGLQTAPDQTSTGSARKCDLSRGREVRRQKNNPPHRRLHDLRTLTQTLRRTRTEPHTTRSIFSLWNKYTTDTVQETLLSFSDQRYCYLQLANTTVEYLDIMINDTTIHFTEISWVRRYHFIPFIYFF